MRGIFILSLVIGFSEAFKPLPSPLFSNSFAGSKRADRLRRPQQISVQNQLRPEKDDVSLSTRLWAEEERAASSSANGTETAAVSISSLAKKLNSAIGAVKIYKGAQFMSFLSLLYFLQTGVFSLADPSVDAFLSRTKALNSLITYIAASRLAAAATHHRLSSNTYIMLNTGLLISGVFSFFSLRRAAWVFWVHPVLSCLAGALGLGLSEESVSSVQRDMTALKSMANTMTVLFMQKGKLLRTVMLLMLLTSTLFAFFPGTLLASHVGVPPGEFTRVVTSDIPLSLASLWVVQDAAQRGRLEGGTFKRLTSALCLSSLLQALMSLSSPVISPLGKLLFSLPFPLLAFFCVREKYNVVSFLFKETSVAKKVKRLVGLEE